MNTNDLFPVTELCRQHHIEVTFVHELHENGLVEIERIEETEFVNSDTLTEVERFIRLHYDLDINMEGLEAVHHLLEQMQGMQKQIMRLENELNTYHSS